MKNLKLEFFHSNAIDWDSFGLWNDFCLIDLRNILECAPTLRATNNDAFASFYDWILVLLSHTKCESHWIVFHPDTQKNVPPKDYIMLFVGIDWLNMFSILIASVRRSCWCFLSVKYISCKHIMIQLIKIVWMKWYRQMVTHRLLEIYLHYIWIIWLVFFCCYSIVEQWTVNTHINMVYILLPRGWYSWDIMMPLWFSANKCTGFCDVFGWHVYGTEIYAEFYPHT